MKIAPMAGDEERPRWRDSYDDVDDEPRDWEIEPEEERADPQATLSGTAPVARVVFLGLVLLFVLGGVLALVRGLGLWFGQ